MADRMLEQVQFGLETTIFTPITTPTVKMQKVKEATLKPVIPSMVNKALGSTYAPGFIAVRDSTGAEATMKGIATYEQINYILECAFGQVSPSGAGPYVRAGSASNAALPTLRPLTVYKGDAIDATYKMSGGLIKELTLKAEQSDKDTELTYEAKFEGGAITSGTLASISDTTYTPIVASDFAIYVDAVGGTMGATVVASTAYGFELKLAPNYYFSRYLGNRAPTTAQQRQFDSDANSLKLSMELNATSKAFYDAMISSTVTQYQVRVKATNGTNVMQFDFAGFAKEAPEQWQDRDGLKTVDMELFAIYNIALGNWFKYSNTSSLATL